LPVADAFAEIIVNKKVRTVNRVFHYEIPEALKDSIEIGSIVLVPFGKEDLEGVVVSFVNESEVRQTRKIKQVISRHPVFDKNLIELACWMADYYLCPKASVLQGMLPAGLGLAGKDIPAKKVDCAFLTRAGEDLSLVKNSARKQREILLYLKNHSGEPVIEILRTLQASRSSIKSLVDKGMVRIITQEVYRDPYNGKTFPVKIPEKLSPEQEKALDLIQKEFVSSGRPVLIHGVTGSGKTEIYLRVIESLLKNGKQSIVLVPEIALTPQMVAVFKSRLREQVAVLHSGLSEGERRDAWTHIASGRLRVVVGARSAVFAPCRDLGLIIIDEEHEPSYKQENTPRFHTREVALKRARISGAHVIMGSATPSTETYYRALQGEFCLVNLTKRVENRPLAYVHVADMRQELKNGNKSVLSRLLQTKLLERYHKKEQSLLFLNRRGYNTFVSCRSCGFVLKCSHCDISLTYHANEGRVKCHYCGYSSDVPVICPSCGNKTIRHFGSGTQRVEEEVKKLLPQARVVRVDADSASHKGFYDLVYGNILNGEVDVVVGTQMIAKGLDFPQVTLVGVVAADMLLHFPEMRAGERTFQLLTQVAGRAGRGEIPGEVVLQTYSPDDPAIMAAANQNYGEFYHHEIEKRKRSAYPPFGFVIRVLAVSINLAQLEQNCDMMAGYLEACLEGKAVLLGPAPAPLERIKDRYRMQMVIKGDNLVQMQRGLTAGLAKAAKDGWPEKDVLISIDVEPLNMM